PPRFQIDCRPSMMPLKKLIRPVLVFAVLGLAALSLAACGSEEHGETVVEGELFELGELQYNVLFTRPLNIDDVEDRDYLVGHEPPPAGSSYLGVFVQIKNLSDQDSQTIPADLKVTDTDGDSFE